MVLRLLAAVVVALVVAACGVAPAALPSPASSLLQAGDGIDGTMVYVRDGNLWILRREGSRQLTTGGSWRQPALSADGTEIAYVHREENFSDLFVMASDGSANRRLTRGQSAVVGDNDWALRPAWSRDGSQLAYISDVNSLFPLLWVMNKDGSAKRQVMTVAMELDVADAISWAPDGKRLAVTAMNRQPSQIYVLDVGRGTAERFTNQTQGAFDPAWSPDGTTIAYIGREGARGELRLKGVEGSAEARSDKLLHVRSPAWSPDGRSLAVLSAQSGAFEVWVASVEIGGESSTIGELRQVTRAGDIDAASGLSWTR